MEKIAAMPIAPAANPLSLYAVASGVDYQVPTGGNNGLAYFDNNGNLTVPNELIATGAISGTSATFSSTISASNFSGSSSGTNTGDQNLAPYALLSGATFTGSLVSVNGMQINGINANGGQAVLSSNGTGYNVILRNDNNSFYILLSGSTGGTFNSLRPFSINLSTGELSCDGTGVGTTFGGTLGVTGAITSSSTITGTNCIATSDERLKENLEPVSLAKAINFVNLVDPFYFTWKLDNRRDLGFMAQRVRKFEPLLIHGTDDGVLGLDYQKISVFHQLVLREHHQELTQLKQRVAYLESKIGHS